MKTTQISYSVITGASMGLGKAFASELAKMGRNVILVARPNEGLQDLSKSLQSKYRIKAPYYETDLLIAANLFQLTNWINTNYQIDFLINNVGIGGSESFGDCSLQYLDNIIQLNIKTLTHLCHELLENLQNTGKRAYILNVSSMAAFCPMGFKTIYPASKRFIQHFSMGLNCELRKTNVQVATVFPGPMKTNEGVSDRIEKQGVLAKLTLQPSSEVARVSIKKVLRGKTSIVVGFSNKINRILMETIPNSLLGPLLSNAFKKELTFNS